MDLPESSTHSFVVKVWLEETAEEAGEARWRGHVSHVPDGERRYVERLQDVTAFIAPYLERMGVRLGRRVGLGKRLKRWMRQATSAERP